MRSGCFAQAFALLGGMAILAACASISDIADISLLQRENKGVVVFAVDAEGADCVNSAANIGWREGTRYKQERLRSIRHFGAFKDEIVNSFDPGEYHIFGFDCALGHGYGFVDQEIGYVSLASFRVEAGKVINAGLLTLGKDVNGRINPAVGDLPAPVIDLLRFKYPNILKTMAPQFMTVDLAKLRDEEKIADAAREEWNRRPSPSYSADAWI